jgi:glucose/arabinose dehydrogenase
MTQLFIFLLAFVSLGGQQQPPAERVPINRSFIAFTIPEKDLLPESVAYDPVEQAFYVGSTRKGKIVKVDKQGKITDFIAPRQDGLWMVIGIKIDAARRVLWVNSSYGDNLVGYQKRDGSPAGIFKFDLGSGRLIKKYLLDKPGETHFCNDLAISDKGDVFISHMFRESVIYRITAERDELELFAKPEKFTEPNGIALSADGRTLFVATDEGVSTMDVASKTRHQLGAPADVSLKGIDGLYFYRNSLIAVHPGRRMARRYFLDDAMKSVTRAETLEANHPMMNVPTTGVVVGDQFYYVANAQFGSFEKDGALFPLERLFEPVILKVTLSDAPQRTSLRFNAKPQLIAAGLEIPWAIDFAPDGRIFVTERPGRIRVIENGKLNPEAWAKLDVVHQGDAGLRGLALAPDFATTRQVFVAGTFRASDGNRVNRVLRLTERGGRGVEPKVIVDNLPCPDVHAGGALAFGPDEMLYLTMGDVRRLDAVQDLKSPIGKILRYRPDGSIPPDNPFPDSPVYALGVRNPQGLAWHPASSATGALFATEHGPTNSPGEDSRRDQDELNVITRGANYGWPIVSGMREDSRFVKPLLEWTPAIAPAGLAVCNVKGSPWFGDLFVGGMRGRQLRRIKIEQATAGFRVVEEEPLFHNEFGRLRAVAMGRDGALYFATSNRDGDGKDLKLSAANDDRLFRLNLNPGKRNE